MVNTEIRLITLFAAKDGEALCSQKKTRMGADCGSDHELLIAKFRLKLKKVGQTTRPKYVKKKKVIHTNNFLIAHTHTHKGKS